MISCKRKCCSYKKWCRYFVKNETSNKRADEFGRDEKVRILESLWSGSQGTMMWSDILGKLYQFIRTESRTIYDNAAAIDKILKGEISWRTR